MTTTNSQAESYGWREQHIGRLLLELLKDFQFRSMEQLRSSGYEDITLAYINFIAAVSVEGTRLTDVAGSLGVSKQAAGQMAKELISKSYLSRQADPEDGRATLLTFTSKGEKFLDDAREGIEAIETLYERHLGKASFTSLREGLLRLLEETRGEFERQMP